MVKLLNSPLTFDKSSKIGQFVNAAFLITKISPYPVIISKYHNNLPKLLKMAESIYMKPLQIFMDEEKIEEILDSIKIKYDPNKVLSINQGMELISVILFPPDNRKKEILMEAIDCYCNSKITNPQLRFVLYTVFYCMIDAYIDDEDEFERLINMINPKATPEERNETEILIRMKESLAELTSKEELVSENEILSDGIQSILNDDADVSAEDIKSKLRKLLSKQDQLPTKYSKPKKTNS